MGCSFSEGLVFLVLLGGLWIRDVCMYEMRIFDFMSVHRKNLERERHVFHYFNIWNQCIKSHTHTHKLLNEDFHNFCNFLCLCDLLFCHTMSEWTLKTLKWKLVTLKTLNRWYDQCPGLYLIPRVFLINCQFF